MSLRDDLAHLIAEPRMHTNESLGHARATADAILARYAVVELPPGDGPDDDGQTYFGDFTIRVDHSGPAEPEIYIGGRKADPHFLELRAAEYLAAVRNAKVVEQ